MKDGLERILQVMPFKENEERSAKVSYRASEKIAKVYSDCCCCCCCLRFKTNKGQVRYIDEIQMTENEVVPSISIFEYLTFKSGDVLNRSKFDSELRELAALNSLIDTLLRNESLSKLRAQQAIGSRL